MEISFLAGTLWARVSDSKHPGAPCAHPRWNANAEGPAKKEVGFSSAMLPMARLLSVQSREEFGILARDDSYLKSTRSRASGKDA
ncbi:hypothetical protein AB7M16_005659 [Bradyrhizobium sp. USDA 372]